MGKPPVVAFGSLKGGVGKTTVALCAAELLRAPEKWGSSGLTETPYPVLLIDADVVGTELAWIWKHPSYNVAPVSVQEWIAAASGGPTNKILEDLLRKPVNGKPGRGVLVPSFAIRATEAENRTWAKVFEEHGTVIVKERIRDLVELGRELGYAVVVDLPAFDVGFANHAREAIEAIQQPKPDPVVVFTVTDRDLRSAFAIASHRASWNEVVVNRCYDGFKPTEYFERVGARIAADFKLGAKKAPAVAAFKLAGVEDAVLVHDTYHLLEATTNPEPISNPNPMAALFGSRLGDLVQNEDHARRLRGWRG